MSDIIPVLNLVIRTGQTFKQRVVWRDSQNQPVSLVGATVHAQFRDKPGGKILLEMTTGNNRLIVAQPETGEVLIDIEASATAAFTWSKGEWDLRVVFPNGEAAFVCAGDVEVIKSVTIN